uniref:LOB domain-containing protein n=1 Tax=Oryza nivara TaxID=4536 RepID=A0A0E0GRA7_ORYNI
MRDVVVAVGGGTKAASRQQGQGGVTLAAAAAGSGSGSAASPCAACKLLRRRCAAGCVFAPYFPPGEPHKFANVHKVFGASNVSKLLQEIPVQHRGDAVSSLVYEANARVRDPIYGCVGAISSLQQQVEALQAQLALAQAEMVRLRMSNDYIGRRLRARGGGGGGGGGSTTTTTGSPSSMSSPAKTAEPEPLCKPTPELDMVVDQPDFGFWSY